MSFLGRASEARDYRSERWGFKEFQRGKPDAAIALARHEATLLKDNTMRLGDNIVIAANPGLDR
jgi:hypothetical protein